jgi:tRNA(fMet)-specific endonuclease VapC
MRPIAIDTNAYVAFKRGDSGVLEVLRHAEEILLGATVLGELLAGFEAGSRAEGVALISRRTPAAP